MFLSIPSLSPSVANLLLQCFEREWITDLILSTYRNDTEMVKCTLKNHLDHVSYAHDNVDYYSSQMVLYTSPALDIERRQMLCLTGPLFAKIKEKGALCAYTLTFHVQMPVNTPAENSDPLSNAVLPFAMVHRSREHILSPHKSEVITNLLYSVKFSDKI